MQPFEGHLEHVNGKESSLPIAAALKEVWVFKQYLQQDEWCSVSRLSLAKERKKKKAAVLWSQCLFHHAEPTA